MVTSQPTKLKEALEKLYHSFNDKSLIPPDPLQFVYRYSNPGDMEVVALIAASLAYGRVQQISKSLDRLFEIMSPSPLDFIMSFNSAKRGRLKDFKHRFNKGDDIADLLVLLKHVIKKYDTLEAFFLQSYDDSHETIVPALTGFCQSLGDIHQQLLHRPVSKGLMYLLPNPIRKSPCKRMFLFLRWMVRSDNIDTGLWKGVDPSKLIIPMDVHMSRVAAALNFHCHNTISLNTAMEVTRAFAMMTPEDPVKYDFSLCRTSMVGEFTRLIDDIQHNSV